MFSRSKSSKTSSASSKPKNKKDKDKESYYGQWNDPCRTRFHRFDKKDVAGAPDLKSPEELKNRGEVAQQANKTVNDAIDSHMAFYFEGSVPQDVKDETKFYRIDTLPIIPRPTKAFFKNKTITDAMKEVYRYLMFFTPALNQMSLDNLIFPTKISQAVMEVEVQHMVLVCDMEMTMAAFGQTPSKADMDEAQKSKMFVVEVRLMRCFRQYLIMRDYAKLVELIWWMYRYYAKLDLQGLPDT